jgi:hypothetical protein
MLTRLLALIAEGGLQTPDDLASRLGVSREMVEAMLADLQRRGLLAASPSTCDDRCGGCPLAGHGCGAAISGTWASCRRDSHE